VSDDRTYDLSELHGITADQQAVKEANAFRTLRAGNYRLTAEKAEGRLSGDKFAHGAGIKMVHLQLDAKPLAEGGRGGKLFQDITFVTLRKESGKLERQTALWGQYEKALGVVGKEAPDVIAAILAYPVDGFIQEMFVAPDNTLHFYRTEEERAELVKQGMEPKNFISSVRAAK
jgi:hypothetical protein